MGIKFRCPNGHKLNVKSFLSGKRAICPKCGARVVVPGEPDGSAETESAAGSVAASTFESMADGVGIAPGTMAAPQPSQKAEAGDAIDEAPSAVWYVRPATGGQFGPASGDVMRAWLKEGRVGASSLVWRAGWPEWRAASAIFPQLAMFLASPAVSVAPPQALASASVSRGTPPGNGLAASGTSLPVGQAVQSVAAPASGLSATAAPPLPTTTPGLRRRQNRNQTSVLVIAGLVLLTIILAVTLFFVFPRQPSPAEATAEPGATGAASN